jgi:cell division septation protein DedD
MGTLVALAAVAFALGAGAGFLWKEPGLLLAHWMGGTQEVAWSDAPPQGDFAASQRVSAVGGAAAGGAPSYETASATPARSAEVAAERAVQASDRTPAKPAVAAKAAPKASTPAPPARVASAPTPPVAAPPPSGLAVQVGAFSERGSADALVSRLRGAGFTAYAAAPDGGAWRVRVGPFPDRARAEKVAARLKQEQKLPTWILEESR